ncbi:MAG TPA: NUDIX hydrolase [Ktedonosporobacter sp.]|nr:NUDIX hydrolase [Ktedonosporobacter sp.]
MSGVIRVRASLAVIREGKILLVPHYNMDVAPVLWYIPGGAIEFGEAAQDAAIREFREETGFHACAEKIIDVSEVLRPEQPWHSITVTFSGGITGGMLMAEDLPKYARYGDKTPRWFSLAELKHVKYHPISAVQAAFAVAYECDLRKR